MKALFLRLYLYIIVALFFGVFFSEYFVNYTNYQDDLFVENYNSVDRIYLHLNEELIVATAGGVPEVLDKWEDISGYQISVLSTVELGPIIHTVLLRNSVQVQSIITDVELLPADEFWIGSDTDFFEDRVIVIAPLPEKGRWVVYREISSRTPHDNKVFILNQLSLLFAFSLALILFLWPLVKTINGLSQALEKFKQGQLNMTVPVTGPRPLAELNQQFNKMTHELKRRMEEQLLMTSAMSHELKSPITRLRLALDMAIASGHAQDTTELLGEMDLDLSDLDNLTTELLTLAKTAGDSKQWQYEKVDYRVLIEEEASRILKYQKNITLNIFGDASGIASRLYMSRVISNVLGNAFKYARSRISVTLKVEGGYCYIAIEDDGDGIPEQEREKLFMPFYRIDSSRNRKTGGHGIGLAIAWNVISNHKGSIVADRSSLGGLKVLIILPILETI
ncbi:MAG: ATP-binding protein [Oleispira sp.]